MLPVGYEFNDPMSPMTFQFKNQPKTTFKAPSVDIPESEKKKLA